MRRDPSQKMYPAICRPSPEPLLIILPAAAGDPEFILGGSQGNESLQQQIKALFLGQATNEPKPETGMRIPRNRIVHSQKNRGTRIVNHLSDRCSGKISHGQMPLKYEAAYPYDGLDIPAEGAMRQAKETTKQALLLTKASITMHESIHANRVMIMQNLCDRNVQPCQCIPTRRRPALQIMHTCEIRFLLSHYTSEAGLHPRVINIQGMP